MRLNALSASNLYDDTAVISSQIFHQHETVERVGRRSDESEPSVVAACVVVLGTTTILLEAVDDLFGEAFDSGDRNVSFEIDRQRSMHLG